MIRIRQLKIKLPKQVDLLDEIAKKLHISKHDILSFSIVKQSLDAREKKKLYDVYEVDVEVKKEKIVLKKNQGKDIFLAPQEAYQWVTPGKEKLKTRPIIVGSGPAGLFCAYLLAEQGYCPIMIERGEKIEDRIKTVEAFWTSGKLNENSNVQFGEGGAGTFSDGKLNTLVKDKMFRGKKVFEIFVEHGAPEEIMYVKYPHIGTDLLREVVKNIRNKILSMGGEIYYHTVLTDVEIKNEKLVAIEVNHKTKIPCNQLVLAIGHSARDTFQMLYERGLVMHPKAFAVGVRVEHPQSWIDEAQYGKVDFLLPKANYKLAYQTKKENRGVYSFCMCPGGYVINASSEEERLVINGMSNYRRDSGNANSAIVVSVGPKDFGNQVMSGVEFQRKLEELAYLQGKGKIPIQRYQDFVENKKTTAFGMIHPKMKGEYVFSNLNEVLPSFVSDAIKEAFPVFGKKIKNFDFSDVLLSGVESRTSSPIQMKRNERSESNILGIYPCGEGAGYAGGITTSAMDGIKVAEQIVMKYQPLIKM